MDTNFIGIIISAIVIIIGWVIAHKSNVKRDTLAKRRDLRVQYLLAAYRQLENTANRPINTHPETKRAFESAVADIQLLGTRVQINALLTYLNQYIEEGTKHIDPVLKILRDDLRKELNLEIDIPKIHQFRFKDNPEN